MTDYAAARLNMVEGQLRPNKVSDEALLDAFLTVPRERFVPVALRGNAYVDDELPLGNGRRLMEPMVLARLLQTAGVGPADKVLEIGCATGYATCVLARIAGKVTALESDPRLADAARARLTEQGATNVSVVEGKLADGWPQGAPYDVVLVNGAAVGAIPSAVAEQLAEGGRLVGIVIAESGGPGAGLGEAMLMTRAEGVLSSRPIFDAGAAVLPSLARAPSFVF
jgi:protein-L-isoaspartate(D-aspartate) O-methyltransferase